jgi:hypothetical protein
MRLSPPSAIVFIIISTLSINTYADQCESNFTTSGNLITGTTYKTFAELPNVTSDSAYQGAYADIAKEPSWKILSGDKANGMIQVVQASSYAKGKAIPLNIIIESISNGSKVSMTYATPTATLSPESAVKAQFCQTIAAAKNYSGVSETTSSHPENPKVLNNMPRQMPGRALITTAQQNKIAKELVKKTGQKKMQTKMSEASSVIQEFLENDSCINDWSANSSRLMYFAPNSPQLFGPMLVGSMRYHNKQQCLTVARIGGWTSPALNAIAFSVTFQAEDSGEVVQRSHELVKQPDGEWLFTR